MKPSVMASLVRDRVCEAGASICAVESINMAQQRLHYLEHTFHSLFTPILTIRVVRHSWPLFA
jgi:hypothetical protein